MTRKAKAVVTGFGQGPAERYQSVRDQSLRLCAPLEIEDYLIQAMDDASPPKWHLAHVSWFFETFLLKPYLPAYRSFHDQFEVLFNSYYNGVGDQFPRARRGTLSRPTVAEVLEYRRHVDEGMNELLAGEITTECLFRLMLGLNHEQQHQELLLTDLKYNFGSNPLHPAYREAIQDDPGHVRVLGFREVSGSICQMGRDPGAGLLDFCFDNECPAHPVLLGDFAIADRLVSNREYLEFMDDDGYERPELWLSDAWNLLRRQTPEQRWQMPLYWRKDGDYFEYTLTGLLPLRMNAPVCHVSAYEADAFARWKGRQSGERVRLPTEQEWEFAAGQESIEGNFVESGMLHPVSSPDGTQMFGDVWEWTGSSYAAYPGFVEFDGALGEYNGKFMANQLVLRGGSCVTPRDHVRATYRNFFYPKDRWQFSGIRLAMDG